MSSILESQRSALEELDRIEEALSERIKFNPSILPDGCAISNESELHGVKKRSYRETVLQEQEAGRFLKRYREQCEFLNSSFTKVSALKGGHSIDSSDVAELSDELIASHPATQRQQELAAIATTNDARYSVLDRFYQQVDNIKSYHRQYPNQETEDLKAQYQMGIIGLQEKKQLLESGAYFASSTDAPSYDDQGNFIPQENPAQQAAVNALMEAQNKGVSVLLSSMAGDLDLDTVFSGEEFYGKYLDLVAFHERFVNLPYFKFDKPNTKNTEHNTLESFSNGQRVRPEQLTYLNYLGIFASFSNNLYFPTARLRSDQYFSYIAQLHQYLQQFFQKTRLLENSDKVITKIEKDFEQTWDRKLPFPGWFNSRNDESKQAAKIEDGVETLQGFYCSACTRYFAKESVYKSHLTGKKHIKNEKLLQTTSSEQTAQKPQGDATEPPQDKLKLLALHEYCITNIVELLKKQVTATLNNIERRRALTDRERHLELESLDTQDQFLLEDALNSLNGPTKSKSADGEDDEDEDGLVYNPLKLPLGWDGKPIPFWLWKLHGLGVQYPCEICGNHVYMGRKIFEKHFAEARHVHGLRCLGVVPGVLFNGITKIKDALALWEKVRRDNRLEEGRKENVVEMEDEEGNVMTEKVYNDLKKQGLL